MKRRLSLVSLIFCLLCHYGANGQQIIADTGAIRICGIIAFQEPVIFVHDDEPWGEYEIDTITGSVYFKWNHYLCEKSELNSDSIISKYIYQYLSSDFILNYIEPAIQDSSLYSIFHRTYYKLGVNPILRYGELEHIGNYLCKSVSLSLFLFIEMKVSLFNKFGRSCAPNIYRKCRNGECDDEYLDIVIPLKQD